MTEEQQEKEVKELAEEIAEATAKGAYTSKELAQHLISKGYRKAGDTISQDSIKAMKKAEAIQFGRIIPIDHDRKG
jgi:isocitrate/isopropylmalate dehydrogenase